MLEAKTANALSGYIEILYEINKSLIKLCGTDPYVNYLDNDKDILNIIREIPRIVPYSYDKSSKELTLNIKDGLLEFNEDVPFLYESYKTILSKHYSFLNNIRKIRNKFEHKIHGITFNYSAGSPTCFSYGFNVEEEIVSLSSTDLINLFKELNILFSKTINYILESLDMPDIISHPYFKRLKRFDFIEFNNIYEDKNLNTFGKIMYGFY